MSVVVDPSLARDRMPSPWLGQSVAPAGYQLVRELGTGGMAAVVLATPLDAAPGTRNVAIKLIREDYARDQKFRTLFETEARLSSRLDHPNIVQVLDHQCSEGSRAYLVMEYVNGVDLSVALRYPRPLPVSVTAFIASQMLRALAYAHALPNADEIRGVVHRDLSPQNVLLSWEGAVKVADFGIAKALFGSSVSGSAVGKPGYMSPEQMRGDRLDGRSDLYSAGVVLWEMLTGRRLYGQGRVKEVFAEIALGNIPAPSTIRPEVPERLDQVTSKLLALKKDQRYRRAEEALSDLEACLCLPSDGAAELRELLAERFHQPPAGSDGISVMAEERLAFDAAEQTGTIRTETDDPWEAPEGASTAKPGDSEVTTEWPPRARGAASSNGEQQQPEQELPAGRETKIRRRAAFVVGAMSVGVAVALVALFTVGGARMGNSAAAPVPSPTPAAPTRTLPKATEPEPLMSSPQPVVSPPVQAATSRRRKVPARQKATPSAEPQPPTSGIVDVYLDGSGR